MHRTLFIFLGCFFLNLLCQTQATAALKTFKGVYVGGQVGETNTHFNTARLGLQTADVRIQGFSGRAYGGYAFNDYFALEAGYLRFSPTRVLNINNTGVRGNVDEHSIDAVLRASYPLKHGFQVSGKFGLAYLEAEPNAVLRANSTNFYTNASVAHYRPIYGAGASYDVNSHVAVTGSWLHLHEHRALPRGDLIALGLELKA